MRTDPAGVRLRAEDRPGAALATQTAGATAAADSGGWPMGAGANGRHAMVTRLVLAPIGRRPGDSAGALPD